MGWQSVNLQWPGGAMAWLDLLDSPLDMAQWELDLIAGELQGIADLVQPDFSPVKALAESVMNAGREAIDSFFSARPHCVVVSPFQSGSGLGYQRSLSAPQVLQLLADKLGDVGDPQRPRRATSALAVLFLGTHYGGLANALAQLTELLPLPELARIERRARWLQRLESEKWHLPSPRRGPAWATIPLERFPFVRASHRQLRSQLSTLEGFVAEINPVTELRELQRRKGRIIGEIRAETDRLQERPSGQGGASVQVRLLKGSSPARLGRELLQGTPPGHEWALCAGMLLVGDGNDLDLMTELLGL